MEQTTSTTEGTHFPPSATDTLRRMSDIYRMLVEATADSIYVVDGECRYLFMNPRHCSRIGLSPEEIVGRNYREFHSPQEAQIFTANVAEVFSTGASFQRQYCSSRDGSEFLRTFSPVQPPASGGKITAVAIISKNITQWKLAEELYATLAEKSPIGIFVVQDRRFQWANRRFLENTGYRPEEILGADSLFMVHPDDRERVAQSARAMMRDPSSAFPCEYRVVTKKGDVRWYMGTAASIEYKYRRATLGCQMDISLQKRAEEALRQSEERSQTIISSITDAYYEVDLTGHLLLFNDAYLKLFGYNTEEMTGTRYTRYADKKNAELAVRIFSQVFKTGIPVHKMEWEIIHKSGERRIVELSVNLVRDANGSPTGFRGIMSDITERREAEESIRRQAFHDSLTNLANRILFKDRMIMAVKRGKRMQKQVAVLMLDLDNFKDVNDRRGHAAGDLLLKNVADRLALRVRDTDTVARQGGDEFSIVLSSLNSTEDALMIAGKIVASFNRPFLLDAMEVHVTASVGIALYPDHGDNCEDLLKKADQAMYEAKNLGRNRACLYRPPAPPG
ncbi:MAG: PAS domain S-box protein [Syntrophaceae bacterium]|nr:PAS domain S-box protein [Syntrophaceae bacterium]